MSQDILTAISDAVGTEVFGIWFLIGAALVFFMQAGFAMVEAGLHHLASMILQVPVQSIWSVV